MMAKRKLLLIPFIVALIVSLGILFAGCAEPTKYAITWEVDSHATVTVVGAETRPEEIEEEATLSFKVTPATGYEITSVRINDRAVNADKNGVYSTIVKANVKISVETAEVIETVTVKTNPTKMTYYAGEALDAEGMEVEVKYATNRTETVEDYSVIYTDGTAFVLGDTSFSVKYKGVTSPAVTIEAVKGLITLNLNHGSLTEEQLTALSANQGYNYDSEKGLITWTYDAALTEDITLPEPTLPVEGVDFPFLRWSGESIKNGKVIPAGTKTCIVTVASYETKLVELATIGLITEKKTETVGEGDEAKEVEVTVPYLVITGEYKAATKGYLFLYEGNPPPVSLKGDEFEKASNSSALNIKFDLRKLAAMTDYSGKWMDIKFCSMIGTTLFTQEIDLNNYASDFIVGEQEITILTDTESFTYGFKQYTPKADELIKGSGGEKYVGNEKLLKVFFNKTILPDFTLTNNTLEIRDSKPYLIITGECVAIKTKADAETKLANFIKDLQNFSGWAEQTITQTTTVTEGADGKLTFEVAVCLENVQAEGNYVMHSDVVGALPGHTDSNYNPGAYDKDTKIIFGDYKYSIAPHSTGWGWDWMSIKVVDKDTPDEVATTPTTVGIVAESDTAYLVISGTHEATAEGVIAYLSFVLNGNKGYDLQPMGIDGDWGERGFKASGDNANATVTATETTWTIKVDLVKLLTAEAKNGNYVPHLYNKDLLKTDALSIDETNNTATVGGKTYKVEIQNHWNADRPIVIVEDAATTPEVTE